MARAAQSRPASARAQQCLAVQQRAHPLPAAGKRTGRAMHGKGRLRQAPWVHRHRTRTRSTNLPRAGACHPRRHHQTWSMCGFRVQPPRPPRRLRAALISRVFQKEGPRRKASRTKLEVKRGRERERARASVKRERRGVDKLDERTGFHRCGHPGWSADAGLVPMPPTYRPLLVSRRLAAAYTRAAPCSTRERPFSPAERVDLAPPHGARSDRCARNSHTATPTQVRITNGNCPAPRNACAACTAWMQSPCLQQDASNEHVYGPC